jgi:hypothetical protein
MYQLHFKNSQEKMVIEYEKVETEQVKSTEQISFSLSIRDRIISTYRQEIDNFNLMNSDFTILQGYIEDLRRRKEDYDMSMEMMEREYE